MQKTQKKTWDTINEVQGKTKKSEGVSKINVNGAVETDPLKIASEFNSFFYESWQTDFKLHPSSLHGS
jgi:hypothetical protein